MVRLFLCLLVCPSGLSGLQSDFPTTFRGKFIGTGFSTFYPTLTFCLTDWIVLVDRIVMGTIVFFLTCSNINNQFSLLVDITWTLWISAHSFLFISFVLYSKFMRPR